MTTKAEREAAERKTAAAGQRAASRAAAASEEISVPKTTASIVDDDVQKVQIVSGGAQPIDEKATRETVEQDRAQTEAREFANSPAGRLRATPLMFIDDPIARRRYVGVPPAEGEVSMDGTPSRALIKVALSTRAPERGLQVYPESGDPFTIPEGVTEWAAVVDGEGNPLIAAVKDDKKAAAKSSR